MNVLDFLLYFCKPGRAWIFSWSTLFQASLALVVAVNNGKPMWVAFQILMLLVSITFDIIKLERDR